MCVQERGGVSLLLCDLASRQCTNNDCNSVSIDKPKKEFLKIGVSNFSRKKVGSNLFFLSFLSHLRCEFKRAGGNLSVNFRDFCPKSGFTCDTLFYFSLFPASWFAEIIRAKCVGILTEKRNARNVYLATIFHQGQMFVCKRDHVQENVGYLKVFVVAAGCTDEKP